jgi:hypothetical protein
VTEQEWQECKNPWPILGFLRPKEKEHAKQLRRFAVGCCYHTWHLLPEEGQRLVEVGQQFEEGTIARHQRAVSVAALRALHGRFGADTPILRAAYRCKDIAIDVWTAAIISGGTALAAAEAADSIVGSPTYIHAYTAELAAQTDLILCIIPFRPVILDPAWSTPAVVQLARSLYEERRFEDLPVLADALEEAGCQDAAVLGHCRGPGPHVRDCWVVDLLLGKE